MPPRPLFLVLSFLLLAAGTSVAQGTRAAPGTDSPQSGVWGPDHEERLRKIFSRLLAASGYDGPGRQQEKRGPTQLLYRKDYRDAAGTPAAAVSARTGPNNTDHAVVFAGYGIFEMCRDEDELAFIVGHEIAHLVLKHPEANQAKALELLEPWSKKNDLKKFKDDDAAVKAFQHDNAAALAAFQRGQEREADREGLALSRLAGFDPKGAATAMQHGQDWVWATTDGTPDTGHDPLPKRVSELRRLALQMEALEKKFAKADGAAGGLKAGARNLSSGDQGRKSGELFENNTRERVAMAGAAAGAAAPLLGGAAGSGALQKGGALTADTRQRYMSQADDRPVPAPAAHEEAPSEGSPWTRAGFLSLGAAALAAAAAFSIRR